MLVPTISAGNSKWPPQNWQLPFKYLVIGIELAEKSKPISRS